MKSARSRALPAASWLRLQRVLRLEAALLEHGVARPTRFERPGCFGAFGTTASGEMIELRIDLFSGDLFEVEYDAASHALNAANALPA